jgi:hypothetical protein
MNALAIETGPSNAYIVNAWTIEAPNAQIIDHTPNHLVVRTVRRLLARGYAWTLTLRAAREASVMAFLANRHQLHKAFRTYDKVADDFLAACAGWAA